VTAEIIFVYSLLILLTVGINKIIYDYVINSHNITSVNKLYQMFSAFCCQFFEVTVTSKN